MAYIDFAGKHTTVVGQTQSGKTYGVMRSVEVLKQGVFFFNAQHIPVGRDWITVTGKDDLELMIRALQAGEKLNFMTSREHRWKQLVGIVKALFEAAEQSVLDIYVIFDEIHLADQDAKKSAIEVATTGLRWGLKAIYISQRFALIDNTLMTQSTNFVIFHTSPEPQYFKQYALPYDGIMQGLEKGGQYAYMVYDIHSLRGPFKV